MEWAEAIVTEGRSLAVSVINSLGEQAVLPIQELSSRGVPSTTSCKRGPARIRLSDLKRCSADEYLDYFEVKPSKEAPAQAVFRYIAADGAIWQIPALVMMRAVFKPNSLLLEQVFRPQSLELLAVGARGPKASPRFLMAGTRMARNEKYNPTPSLNWFWRDQRAWAMAHSVHKYAMDGWLDLDLPDVEVELGVKGLESQRRLFVTSASIRTVYISPDLPGGEPVKLTLNGAATAGLSVAGVQQKLRVQAAADGRLTTNEQEWCALAEHLKSRNRPSRPDRRKELFDGLLEKLSGQVSAWRRLGKPGLSWHLHESYYRKWTASGELKAMLDTLEALRTEESKALPR